MKNKISGYRKMLGKNQVEMAKLLKISVQAYRNKENGRTEFNDSEKLNFKNELKKIFPEITIDSIFF